MGRRKKFENRYDVIVETASKLFIQHGFEGTTMDDIAKACDLGKATLYAEFQSKEDLITVVIVRYIREAHAKMRDRAAHAQDRFLEVLADVLLERILGIYDRATKHFHSAEILMSMRKELRERAKVALHQEEEMRILANILEKAAMNGEIARHDSYFHLAKIVRKALTGLFPPHIFDISRDHFEADAREIIGIVLAGLTVNRT